jgi:hypothetical protein
MSTKGSISFREGFHLYFQELLNDEPNSVFLELQNPKEYRIEKETFGGTVRETIMVEIASRDFDKMAIDWIIKRKLQGSVGGPVGAEWGSTDCPWD